METCELKVPVPWGHIAIKAWGNSTDDAVIVLHGLADNAGSFDTLIPLLPRSFYYLCVDLPGHGRSSHFPSTVPIHYTNYIIALVSITEYFNKEKYIFLAHSFGGRLAMLFTQIFPNKISKIAVLDVGYNLPNAPERYFASILDSHELLKKTLTFKPGHAPTYSYEEIIHKIIDSRYMGTLTYDTAEQLANRMVKEVGDDKYEFTYDQKLRQIVYPSFSLEYIKQIFRKYPIKCPAMAMYCTDTKELVKSRLRMKVFFNLPPKFKTFQVDGHHHSHHTDPDKFAPMLTKFLLRQSNKL